MIEPGDWTGPGGAPPDPRPARHRRGGPRDGPWRHRPARRRLRVERGERPDERHVRPPRPAGHPHPARAGRGEGRRSAGSRRPMAGSCSTPTTALVAAVARRVRGRVAFFSTRAMRRPSFADTAPPGRRAYCARDAAGSSRPTATARHRIVEVAQVPITIGGLARYNIGQCPRGGRRGARPGRHDRGGPRRSASTSAPSAERSPGRLNLFRLGARVVIVDFAHNEAGVAAILDVAEGIAAGAAGRAAPITAIIGTAGDRPDDTLRGIGRIAAERAHSGSSSSRRSTTCAAGPPNRSSGSCSPASGRRRSRGRRPDLRLRDRGTPGRAQRRGRRTARTADGPTPPGSSS